MSNRDSNVKQGQLVFKKFDRKVREVFAKSRKENPFAYLRGFFASFAVSTIN
jgi:hypothetical protein